jgi:hypothetical protein
VSDIEAAAAPSELPGGRRRWLAVLVGVAAVLAAVFTWAERDSSRLEEQSLQDATRGSLQIFVAIAGSQARSQFTADNARRSLLVGSEGLARVVKARGEALRLAVSRSGADTRTQKRLLDVAQEMDDAKGRDTPVDGFTAQVISTDDAARSGRIALITAGVALLFAAVYGGSGFLL